MRTGFEKIKLNWTEYREEVSHFARSAGTTPYRSNIGIWRKLPAAAHIPRTCTQAKPAHVVAASEASSSDQAPLLVQMPARLF